MSQEIEWEANGNEYSIPVESLVQMAESAREDAYAPYSDYQVGSALLCNNGGIIKGYNVEVSGRSTSVHAEMMALFKAVSAPDTIRPYRAMAISHEGNQGPCGLCLHTMSEFVDDMKILVEDDDEIRSFNLSGEYKNAYRPENSHERRELE